ncbi:hypothetical protein LQW54_007715 [Pestalotiopsis sp. IQ-011]
MVRPLVLDELVNSPDYNPQTQSPLFHRIPTEIRDFIFQYALQEYCPPNVLAELPDLDVRHDHEPVEEASPSAGDEELQGVINAARSTARSQARQDYGYDWLRPDNVEPMTVTTALLRTCRRVYVETYRLPAAQKEHRFYMMRGGYGDKAVCSVDMLRSYFAHHLGTGVALRSSPIAVNDNSGQVKIGGTRLEDIIAQRDMIRRVRLFTQQYWLEDSNSHLHFWSLVANHTWLQPVEHLRITIRRGDWWYWESSNPLRINPFRTDVTTEGMYQDIERAAAQAAAGEDNINPDFSPRAWGLAFQHLPNLKTLAMDFETAENQRHELDRIVGWAVGWRLPLAPNPGGRPRFLSTQGRPVDKMSWRGQNWHAQGQWPPRRVGRRTRAVAAIRPPRLFVSTVTWVACEDRLESGR